MLTLGVLSTVINNFKNKNRFLNVKGTANLLGGEGGRHDTTKTKTPKQIGTWIVKIKWPAQLLRKNHCFLNTKDYF